MSRCFFETDSGESVLTNSNSGSLPRPLSPNCKTKEIILTSKSPLRLHKSYRMDTGSINTGEHQWVIDAKLLKPMITAKNQEKFISPKFKMSHLTWQLEAYPNGNTPQSMGSFNLYLRLVTMPLAWRHITLCRTFRCNETKSGYTAVSRYEKNTSLGWPDFSLSLQDIKNRIHWMEQLTFTVNVKILQISLFKNDGELFYEARLDPYRALKKQSIAWKLDQSLLHEMKMAYFKKGFVSPIYNSMWCLRCYPNGKTQSGDFLVQLQLCGLPLQTGKLAVRWKVNCEAVRVSAGWTTNFDFGQSCWGWGNGQLSFEEFKKCDEFTISVDVTVDDKVNIVAMAEWEKYVRKSKRSVSPSASHKQQAAQYSCIEDEKKEFEPKEKDSHMIGVTQQQLSVQSSNGSPLALHKKSDETVIVHSNEQIEWMEKRLKIQDDILEELTKEIDHMKHEMEQWRQLQQLDAMQKRMQQQARQHKQDVVSDTDTEYSLRTQTNVNASSHETDKIQQWLQGMKLSHYFELFMQHGFDDVDAIADITKEDLVQMGIDKIGHHRKILKNVQNL
mmetsp:Transcript_13095/g.19831  ORF Transcript_13095/g.19831 Transcript_13095/m.19831 type:complete len:558 (-) Transcript_13095:160-1833(-)